MCKREALMVVNIYSVVACQGPVLTGARSSRHLLFAHLFSRHAYRHENIIPIPIYKKSWCPFSELESISNVKRICSKAGLVCMSDSRCVLKDS